jgi:hypothetical protein
MPVERAVGNLRQIVLDRQQMARLQPARRGITGRACHQQAGQQRRRDAIRPHGRVLDSSDGIDA